MKPLNRRTGKPFKSPAKKQRDTQDENIIIERSTAKTEQHESPKEVQIPKPKRRSFLLRGCKWLDRKIRNGYIGRLLGVSNMESFLDNLPKRLKALPNDDSGLPLVGRKNAVNTVWDAVKLHYDGWKKQLFDDRNQHSRLFVTGPPGIGKTRFCTQLPSLLLEKAHADASTPAELREYLTNTLIIPMSFANGNRITSTDGVIPKNRLADWLLVTRAIYSLFDVGTDVPMTTFAQSLLAAWKNNPPAWFTVMELSAYLAKEYTAPNNKLTLYWHLDEFQSLIPYGVAVDAITLLTAIYAKSAPTFSLVLFSGTLYESLISALGKDSWSTVPIDLSLLTMPEIYELIDSAEAEGKLSWLQHIENGKNNKCLRRILSDTGGVPRILQILFEVCKDFEKGPQSFTTIAETLCTRVRTRFSISDRTAREVQIMMATQHWAFSGQPYDPTAKIADVGLTLEDLHSRGFIQCKKKGDTLYPTIPFMFLSLHAVSLGGLSSLWTQLYDPANKLLWEQFEKVLLMVQIQRIQALLSLGFDVVRVSDLLPGVTWVNTERSKIEKRKIKLQEQTVLKLQHCWPSAKHFWPVPATETTKQKLLTTPLTYDELPHMAFLNAAGASGIDGFQLFSLNDEEGLLLVAHQNKFTNGTSKLTAKEVANSVQDFFKTSTDVHRTLNQDATAKKFLAQVVSNTVFLIVTNREQEEDFMEKLEELSPYPMAIVTNMEEFLGPLGSTIESFQ